MADIARVYAEAVVNADRALHRIQEQKAAVLDVDPENALAEVYDNRITIQKINLTLLLALLESTGALEGCKTEDGKVTRAYILATPMRLSAIEEVE